MDARLFYVVESAERRELDELDDVRLTEDVQVSPVGFLPAETRGTIVAVHGDGEAYGVESAEPFRALLLEADKREPVPGATRERLIAETGDVRRRGTEDKVLSFERSPFDWRVESSLLHRMGLSVG